MPAHFQDPVGLAVRLLRARSAEARFAMLTAALALAATPLDLALEPLERRRYRSATPPAVPLIFVCGPPRSGTTLVAQTLIRHLPVGYVDNLSAVFPRAPIVAHRLFGVTPRNERVGSVSYYGKTSGMAGPNDGLHLWDRWLGPDRTVIRTALTPDETEGMVRFFGAYAQAVGRPLLNKNNSLDVCAELVAEALPTAHFLCLRRDPLYLAQSLLRARREIHGDERVPYGIAPGGTGLDPVEDVCEQVRFHADAAERQRRAIGDDRFWIVSYERFCSDPSALVGQVAERILGRPLDVAELRGRLRPYAVSGRRAVPDEEFERLLKAVCG